MIGEQNMPFEQHRAGIVLCAVVLSACQAGPAVRSDSRVCTAAAFAEAAALPLPPAAEPSQALADKSGPLRYASKVPVNGGIGDIGGWSAAGTGWQAWRLRLTSEGATSLSVHLSPLELPERAELWLCSPDGKLRHGPYRGKGPSGNGQFWSPLVPGPELWMEVLAPDDATWKAKLKIASAFAGFR
jgi:hypothetical protein